jgi:type I restriction enzyme R subunit
MNSKEAIARIKINRLLEKSGWIFFDDGDKRANIQLEPNVKITHKHIDSLGDDFEITKKGYVDFLLLDNDGYPLVVLEAKRESINPLYAKEQARDYAYSLNVRFIILSNGNSHYFWDLERGNPEVITDFPTQDSLKHRHEFKPDNSTLAEETVNEDYIALSQYPSFKSDPLYKDPTSRKKFLSDNNLRILRPYQLQAIKSLQASAKDGNDRFLFEMATGTGKTLVSAAVIKLFLRTGNAKRILFIVDRLELEDQAHKNFVRYLQNDYLSVIYKHNKDDWRNAEIVVTTIQSLTSQDKYKRLFSPTDFDLLIADECHRAIGGNSRAVFEYFIGYKLGLTATPKDYLKNIDSNDLSINDPRAWEKRQLLDTYTTFGCISGEATFKYSLIDGVKDGYLINPIVVDARTDITTQLLSDEGYSILVENEEGEEEETFYQRDFERKFFSKKTNLVFCKTFIENSMKDPISNEVGKSIIFCVSQNHASKITQLLNQIAHQMYPNKYKSDFAVQITSLIQNAQQFTINFANNNLQGHTNFLEAYRSSKTRVCVTVGMMTTGYDCEDVLNIGLMRPIFSPTDFIQIKGRGTRTFDFKYTDQYNENHEVAKKNFKLFDFFANCEYFEEEYNYDEVISLPYQSTKLGPSSPNSDPLSSLDKIEISDPDYIKSLDESEIGYEGMKIDRKLFDKAQSIISEDKEVKEAVNDEKWEQAINILRNKYENKPDLYLNLDKIRKSQNLDRRITWRELLERIFGFINHFKSKDELLEDECEKFISIHKPDSKYIPYIKNFLKVYVTDEFFRNELNNKHFPRDYAGFTFEEYKALNGWRDTIPLYVKDYVRINTFMR